MSTVPGCDVTTVQQHYKGFNKHSWSCLLLIVKKTDLFIALLMVRTTHTPYQPHNRASILNTPNKAEKRWGRSKRCVFEGYAQLCCGRTHIYLASVTASSNIERHWPSSKRDIRKKSPKVVMPWQAVAWEIPHFQDDSVGRVLYLFAQTRQQDAQTRRDRFVACCRCCCWSCGWRCCCSCDCAFVVGCWWLLWWCCLFLWLLLVVARSVREFLLEPNHDLAGALPQLPILKNVEIKDATNTLW